MTADDCERDPELAEQDTEDLLSDLEGVRMNLKRKLSAIPECEALTRRCFEKWEAAIVRELAYREQAAQS